MRILITGICGFVGSTLALALRENSENTKVFGFDNFVRPGSEANRLRLRRAGIEVQHADLRSASDLESLPAADWVIDAAAHPSVLAGVDGQTSSRQGLLKQAAVALEFPLMIARPETRIVDVAFLSVRDRIEFFPGSPVGEQDAPGRYIFAPVSQHPADGAAGLMRED